MAGETERKNRYLVICESPNKIQTLREILGEGFVVMASVGHITKIKDDKNTYWNTGIEPNNDFKTKYVVSSDKKEIVDKLKEQVELATKVYICSDPDREGEAIAWALKKFLKIPNDKYERVTFHEITKNAVLKAFESPRKIDDDLVKAAQARQKLDKLVGYRLSPIANKAINCKSVGRCQSAGLKLLVDREKEIQEFVPETYFDLFLHFDKDNTEFKAKYVGTPTQEIKRIDSLDSVKKIVNECKGNDYIIDSIETKEKLSNPKAPFTTSTFQQEVSNKLGFSVKTAMSYAQKLFEGIDVDGKHIALITYIRTDSPDFAPEFLPVLENYVKNNYGEKYYAPVKKAKKGENTQDGHECLRCVDLEMTPEKLATKLTDKNLVKVYDIIYKRTLQCAFKPSITSETTYTIKNGDNLFTLVSKELLFDGYKAVYGAFEDKDDNLVKVSFNKGEKVEEKQLEAIEQQTKPKPRYKEATFIKELETRGIGRPSTFATIVETILSESRGYCVIEDKCLVPTPKGIALVEFLDKQFNDIISINYTAEMEKSLDEIAKGKLDDIEFLRNFFETLENSAKSVSTPKKPKAELTDRICPECGKPLVKRTGKFGEFFGCSGFPKCKHIER